MLKGIKKLPICLEDKDCIEILKYSNVLMGKLGILDTMLKNSIISENILQVIAYSESVQSTKIEGTQVTFYDIMEANAKDRYSASEIEVLNYTNSMNYGYEQIEDYNAPISSKLIKDLHKRLMKNSRGTNASLGEFRKIQNFIGSSKNIEDAVYIPIDACDIGDYMSNLEHFINGVYHDSLYMDSVENYTILNYDNTPDIIKVAIAHAQFESIHPFLDGNGRLGRILIALLPVYYKLISKPIFFVSEELEKQRVRYYNLLNATRQEQPEWTNWIMFFLEASLRMCNKIIDRLEKADKLYNDYLKQCRNDTQRRVLLATFKFPITKVNKLSEILGMHPQTIKKALDYLEDKKILVKETQVRRNVKYYNYEIMRILAE